jgi:hypothetical protein
MEVFRRRKEASKREDVTQLQTVLERERKDDSSKHATHVARYFCTVVSGNRREYECVGC